MRSLLPGRVATAIAMSALAFALAGCGDDEVALLAPDRGVQGTWVRFAPPVDDVLRDVMPAPPDTLFLESDGRGTWSRTVPGTIWSTAPRVVEAVRYERRGIGLYLSPPDPCLSCGSAGVRATRALPLALYRVRRPDADRLVLVPVAGDLNAPREHYARRSPT